MARKIQTPSSRPATAPSKPASKLLVVVCAVLTWLASAVWTEFREWVGQQTTERTAIIGQFEVLGVEFNSLALKFDVKTAESEKPDTTSRDGLLANIAAQDVILSRVEKYLRADEVKNVESYRGQLIAFRMKLDNVTSIDSMKPYLQELGRTVDTRDKLDARLERVKTSYTVPLTKVRIGA